MRWVLLAGAALFFGLLAGGLVIFVLHEPSEDTERADIVPISQPMGPTGEGYTPKAAAPSSLNMVVKLTPDEQAAADAQSRQASGGPPQAPAASSLELSAKSFKDAIRSCEKGFQDLARSYTERHASIRQYGKDWMSYPDLRKLNDDYMRDHDPIAFLRGLAASPSFPVLMQKYAGDSAVRGFVGDSLRTAPSGAIGASMGYLSQDKQLNGFVQDVATKVGVPPQALAPMDTLGAASRLINQASEPQPATKR